MLMSKISNLFIAIASCLMLVGVPAEGKGFDREKYQEDVISVIMDMEAVGAATIVLKDGATVYSGAFGESDRSMSVRKPFTVNSLVRAGEASCPVISIAVMQLAEQGKVSLDADVSGYLGFSLRNPKYPSKAISLRMLLTGTSSITDEVSVGEISLFDASRNGEGTENLFTGRRPGSKYQESPAAYAIAAAIVEKVSGQRFDLYAKEHIFDPLGIEAGYDASHVSATQVAESYHWNLSLKGYTSNPRTWLPLELDGYKLGESTFNLHPQNGLIISAEGLARLIDAVMKCGVCPSGKRLYSEAAGKELLRQQANRKRQGLAFQYNTTSVPDYVITNSLGEYRGMSVSVYFNAKEKVALIAVCNGSHDSQPDSDGVIGNHFNREMRNLFVKHLID